MNPETTESTTLIQFLAWADQNKKALAFGLAALLALCTVLYIKNYFDRKKQANAEAALFALHDEMTSEEGSGPSPGELLKIADNHAGSMAAPRARLLAAGAFFKNGQFAEAKSEFQKIITDNRRSLFATTAEFGLAACLDAEGRTSEALKAYEGFVSSHPDAPEVAQARLAIARLKESAGDYSGAYEVLKQITSATDFSSWTSQAQEGISRLEREHPELQESLETAEVPNPVEIPALDTNKGGMPETSNAAPPLSPDSLEIQAVDPAESTSQAVDPSVEPAENQNTAPVDDPKPE